MYQPVVPLLTRLDTFTRIPNTYAPAQFSLRAPVAYQAACNLLLPVIDICKDDTVRVSQIIFNIKKYI